MSKEAMLPCFVCGKTLENAVPDGENQPYGGTEFRTYGAYGSTFWDSFDGEELVFNICDECLRKGTARLAQHKRFQPVRHPRLGMVGKRWVDRPMVPYSGNPDNTNLVVHTEELGSPLSLTEWRDNIDQLKQYAQELEDQEAQ